MEQGLQIGFTIEEMTQRVESQLRNMGLIENFAPIIYIVAHGSSSANNPHHGAHDCGACSGRPGSVNARVFSTMANHNEVRKALQEKDIHIPETTLIMHWLILNYLLHFQNQSGLLYAAWHLILLHLF